MLRSTATSLRDFLHITPVSPGTTPHAPRWYAGNVTIAFDPGSPMREASRPHSVSSTHGGDGAWRHQRRWAASRCQAQ
ncbi:MAG: hypothetical protein R3E42_18405 [Burkholderiaceae bacterium]